MAVTRTRRACTVFAVALLLATVPATATAQPDTSEPSAPPAGEQQD